MLSESKLILGTRGSKLAIWQANWVKSRLGERGRRIEIQVIRTSGDKRADVSVSNSGTKGLFIKEIEEALLAGEVDLAVHSLKDLPSSLPPGLVIGAVPAREDARDVLITRDGSTFVQLPRGSRVATGSPRRVAQLRALRNDVELVPIRGNLDTRIRKLDSEACDALVLAAAGVHRLGLASRIAGYFSIEQIYPAVGQGALAIEIRKRDTRVSQVVEFLEDAATRRAVEAERAALRDLGGGCLEPIAIHAFEKNGEFKIQGMVANAESGEMLRAALSGETCDAQNLGPRLARALLERGAGRLLNLAPGPDAASPASEKHHA
ncbi:MAG: hydroxymethylbilane synthase [Terriglobia bacterium]